MQVRSSESKKSFHFFGLPLELRHEIIGYLNPRSMRDAMLSSNPMRNSVITQPDYKAFVKSAREFAENLEANLLTPGFILNDVTFSELCEYVALISKDDATKIIDAALKEHEPHERARSKIVGIVLSDFPEIANRTARAISKFKTNRTFGYLPRDSNRLERTTFIADIFESIEEGAEGTVYRPFVKLLTSGKCMCRVSDSFRLAQSLSKLPSQFKDSVASFILKQDTASEPILAVYAHTLQLFYQLEQLSPDMREAVFSKAQATYNAMSRDIQQWMRRDFAVNGESSPFQGSGLPDSVKEKWRLLFQ